MVVTCQHFDALHRLSKMVFGLNPRFGSCYSHANVRQPLLQIFAQNCFHLSQSPRVLEDTNKHDI